MDLKKLAQGWAQSMAQNIDRAQQNPDEYDDAKFEKERHSEAMEADDSKGDDE